MHSTACGLHFATYTSSYQEKSCTIAKVTNLISLKAGAIENFTMLFKTLVCYSKSMYFEMKWACAQ